MRYQKIGAPGQKGPGALPFSGSDGVKRQGPIAQERLGQANIAMTLDPYSHVTADMQRQAANQLQAALVDPGERIV